MGRSKLAGADRWGAFASGLCAVHCLAVGLAAGLLPLIGMAFVTSPWVDLLFFSMAITFGSLAIRQGFRKHHRYSPLVVFSVGLLMVLIGHEGSENGWLGTGGHVLAALGGATLIAFHFLNAKLSHLHDCAHCRSESSIANGAERVAVK